MTDSSPEPESNKPEAKPSFFAELKRRKVVRVAITYAIVAWLIVQVAAATFPGFEIPMWAFRFVVLMLILGFPVAIILAWAFELTPDGIKLTKNVSAEQKAVTSQARRNWLSYGFAAALPAVIFGSLALYFYFTRSGDSDASSENGYAISEERPYFIGSIAALPFEVIEGGAADQVIAVGLHEELLTQLSGMNPLDVVSRTSTLKYSTGDLNIKTIGAELGADFLVEGSLQRAGEKVRITLQVIDAEADKQLTSKTWDFDPQQDESRLIQQKEVCFEMAYAVYLELKAERPPSEASLALRAEALKKLDEERGEVSLRFWEDRSENGFLNKPLQSELLALIDRISEMDPEDASRLGEYAGAYSQDWWNGEQMELYDPDWRGKLYLVLKRAYLVNPTDFDVLTRLGAYYLEQENRPGAAVSYLRKAVSNFESRKVEMQGFDEQWTYFSLGYALFQSGRPEAGLRITSQIEDRPLDGAMLGRLMDIHFAAREHARWLATCERQKELHEEDRPDAVISVYSDVLSAVAEANWSGNRTLIEEVYQKIKDNPNVYPGVKAYLLSIGGDTEAMLDVISEVGTIEDPTLGPEYIIEKWRAYSYIRSGNQALGESYFRSLLEARYDNAKNVWEANARPGLLEAEEAFIHAFLGETENALDSIAESKARLDPTRDTEEYYASLYLLGVANSRMGRVEEACALLDQVLLGKSPITAGTLMITTELEEIQGTPEFEALIRKHADQLKDPAILETYFGN